MRNMNLKSPHGRPSTVNSFRKNDRIYPQAERVADKKQKINNTSSFSTQIKSYQAAKYQKVSPILSTDNNIRKYHFLAQNAFPIYDRNSNNYIFDQTCLWFKNIQNVPNHTKRSINFLKTQYIISNWGGQAFPHVIYICMDGFNGYLDINGSYTDRVAALQLQQITSTMDESNVRTYQLRYNMLVETKWLIPIQTTHIRLSIKIDGSSEAVVLPLPNQIIIQFEINEQ